MVEVEAGLGALDAARSAAPRGARRRDRQLGRDVKALRARLAVARAGNVEARIGDPRSAAGRRAHASTAAYCANVTCARERVLPELRRVLKPGARAVVAGADDRDALVEDMALAGFDEVTAHSRRRHARVAGSSGSPDFSVAPPRKLARRRSHAHKSLVAGDGFQGM